MVDQEGTVEHQQPAKGERRIEQPATDGIFHRPQHAPDRLPVAEQQDQRQAGKQHIRAALRRLGHQADPPTLEHRPRHQAVLHGECRQQQDIDGQGLQRRQSGRAVERARQ
ncbi:hypothetical protein D3C84_1004910 [compost metagenome]